MTGTPCEQKWRLLGLIPALAALVAVNRRRGGQRIYKCRRCWGWHLTTAARPLERMLDDAAARAILQPGRTFTLELPASPLIRHRAAR